MKSCIVFPMRRSTVAVALILLGPSVLMPLFCQTLPDQSSAFEVSSIKQHPVHTGSVTVVTRRSPPALPSTPGRRFSFHVTTVKVLIALAYDVQPYQVLELPDWAGAERGNSEELYDVDAIAPVDSPTRPQLRTMLQALLAERCQLKVHRETREVPVYLLTIAKGGVKFKSIAGEPTPQSPTVFTLVQSISRYVEHPILDRTDLTGSYDFSSLHEIALEHPDSAYALSGLLKERFGLELEPKRESTEVLVVDHIQRPSPNP